jgi:hypothetical protein
VLSCKLKHVLVTHCNALAAADTTLGTPLHNNGAYKAHRPQIDPGALFVQTSTIRYAHLYVIAATSALQLLATATSVWLQRSWLALVLLPTSGDLARRIRYDRALLWVNLQVR